MSAALVLMLLHAVPSAASDTVVVCPIEFRAALRPWLDYRSTQGHTFAFVSNTQSAEAIRGAIRQVAQQGRLRFIVLVGDADPAMAENSALRTRCVPTGKTQAKINIRWGSEPQIASDNWFADLDDDQVPDVAVGRLTADSATELSSIVEKILDYERSADFGVWRRRINFVAGLGNFGVIADSILEMTAKKMITDGIPAAYATTMTYGNWRSPYCPDPREFRQATIERLNEGCLFWVYIGHAQRRFVQWVQVPGGFYPILADRDVPSLQCANGSAIACFLSCYSGAYDDRDDCLAEVMLRSPGAPVAILGGSRVTMPYGTTLIGTALLEQYFYERTATLGEAILNAKRKTAQPAGKEDVRAIIDSLASLVSPNQGELQAERLEHLSLYNLIGDPLLRLRHPQAVALTAEPAAAAGDLLEVTGTCPIDGTCQLELVVRRDRLTFPAPSRSRYDASDAALTGFNAVYQRANDPRLSEVTVQVNNGRFRASLPVPDAARGACHVRAFVTGTSDFATGSRDVQISAPKIAEQDHGENLQR